MKTSLKLAVVAVVALSMSGLDTEVMAKGKGRSFGSSSSSQRRSSGGSSFSQRRSSGPSHSQARRTSSYSPRTKTSSRQLQQFNRSSTARRTGGFSTVKPTKASTQPSFRRTLKPGVPRAGSKPSFPGVTKPGKPSFTRRPGMKPTFPGVNKPGPKPGITRPGMTPTFPGVNKPGPKPGITRPGMKPTFPGVNKPGPKPGITRPGMTPTFPGVTRPGPKPFPPIKPKPFPPIKPRPFPPIKPRPFPPIKPRPLPPIVRPHPPIVRPRPPICLPRPDWCHPRPPRCHWWWDLCPPIRHCQPADCVVYTGTYVTAGVQVAGGEVVEARWYLGLKGTLLPKAGLGIEVVEAGSPAELAGLKPGMVITNINGIAIVDETSMPAAIEASGGLLKMTLLEKLGGAEGTATVEMVRLATQSF